MSVSSEFLISREDELSLHKRLVDGDVTASAVIAEIFFDGMVNKLIANNHSMVPEDFCHDAAVEAWKSLVKNPASYKPERGKRLGEYLCMSAQGDLRNLLSKEGRHRGKSLESVQDSELDGKYLEVLDDPSLPLRIQEEVEQAEQGIIPIVRDGLTEGESRALELMMQGERKTTIFAEALGIDHLPKEEQTAEVNRVKNKIKKRIKRGRTGDAQEP